MKTTRFILTFFSIATIFLISGCDESPLKLKDEKGLLVVKITDGPFPIDLVEWAKVTITKVEVKTAGDTGSAPFTTLFEGSRTFDLMKLRNGISDELAAGDLPAGSYNQVRITIDEAGLKIKDGAAFTLKIPSGQQSGLKVFINPSIVVNGGLTSELLIDIDLSKSFVLLGNTNKPDGIKGFHFKPVVRVVNSSTAGTIEGYVSDVTLNMLAGASVWVRKDTVISVTFSGQDGKYAFSGVPAGTYTVGAWKTGFDSLEFKGVVVTAANKTVRNLALKPR